MMAPRAVGREEPGGTELVFNGNRLSVGEDEKFPEMDGGDDCTTITTYSRPLNCTFQNG